MVGYKSGIVERMPRGSSRGLIRSDDGTPYTFASNLLKIDAPTAKRKFKLSSNSRVLFVPGSGNIAKSLKISTAGHSKRGF